MANSYRDYMDTGSELLLSGSFNKAIEMFDKNSAPSGLLTFFIQALEANSKVLPYLWQRGLAYYLAERYDEGIKQFETDMTVNGADVEESVWRFLCIAASQSFDQARQTISVPTGTDKRVPMLQVYNLFAGKGSMEDIHKETDKIPDSALKNRTKFYAYYYIGLYYEAMRNYDAAIENIKKSLTFDYEDYMVALARVQLKKLTNQL